MKSYIKNPNFYSLYIAKMQNKDIHASNSPIQLNAIQTLRAVASIMVVFHHFGMSHSEYGNATTLSTQLQLSNLGAAGVDIFFVISGFIMFYTSKERLNNGNARPDFKRFMLKRLVRIYPTYWFWTSVLLILWSAGVLLKAHSFTFPYIFASYTLYPYQSSNNNFHPLLDQGWTLSFEIYFYVVFCISMLASRNIIRIGIVLILFLLTGFTIQYLGTPKGFYELSTNPILLEFIFGGLVATLFKSSPYAIARPKVVVALGWVLLLMSQFINGEQLRFLAWGIPASLIVLGNVFGDANSNIKSKRPFQNLLKLLGDASYSIYLSHGLFTMLYSNLLRRGYLQHNYGDLNIIVGTSIACLFGVIVYYALEKPLLAYLSKLIFINPKTANLLQSNVNKIL